MTSVDLTRWSWSISRRTCIRFARALGMITLVVSTFLALVCGLAAIQAQRDEARRVDAIVVLLIDQPQLADTQLAYALELYQRGYAARLLLVGHQLESARNILLEQGVPDQALLVSAETEANDAWTRIGHTATLTRQHGFQSVLLVNQPSQLLRDLKMAHDMDITAYGSPVPDMQINALLLIEDSLAYWKYILLGPG